MQCTYPSLTQNDTCYFRKLQSRLQYSYNYLSNVSSSPERQIESGKMLLFGVLLVSVQTWSSRLQFSRTNAVYVNISKMASKSLLRPPQACLSTSSSPKYFKNIQMLSVKSDFFSFLRRPHLHGFPATELILLQLNELQKCFLLRR